MYSTSAAASTTNPPLSQSDNRRSSRSTSLSSSSTTTVKRSSSLNSAAGSAARPSTAPYQPRNPVEEGTGSTRLPKPQDSRRRSSIAYPAIDNLTGVKGGIGNLNRWSQSTTSSRSSARDSRQNSFSRRMSVGVTTLLASPHGSTAPHSPPSRKQPSNPRRSPGASPQRRTPSRSPGAAATTRPLSSLPPLAILPTLPRAGFDPVTPSPATTGTPPTSSSYTPSTHVSSAFDYFSAKPQGILVTPERRRAATRRDKPTRSPLSSPHIISPHSQTFSRDGQRPLTTSQSALQASRQVRFLGRSTIQQGQGDPQDRVSLRRNRSVSDSGSRAEDGNASTPPHTTDPRERDRKTMLSTALQKANTAVMLDNVQNFEGAIEAYKDACRLLQQVMLRSTEEEDRRKLDSIRITYRNRIEELHQLEAELRPVAGKSLPARPMSDESIDSESRSVLLGAINDREPAIIRTATMTTIVNDSSLEPEDRSSLDRLRPGSAQRESSFTPAFRDVESATPVLTKPFRLELPMERTRSSEGVSGRVPNVGLPMDRSYMPAPLSPRRPVSPDNLLDTAFSSEQDSKDSLRPPQQGRDHQHSRGNSNESMSWLNTIDESGGSSCSSSIHSVSSGIAVQRKRLRATSGATEAEFDAALDAAVEAAYDDGLEPYRVDDRLVQQSDTYFAASTSAKLVREQAGEAERELAIRAARDHESERQLREEPFPGAQDSENSESQDREAEEEERLLDEMTKEYMLDGFDFGLQSKSALPYESDSSSFSGYTWNSSVSSHRTTTTTSLSTVSESTIRSSSSSQIPTTSSFSSTGALAPVSESAALSGQMPPPAGALPRLPGLPIAQASSVRSRRMSGQNPKQLKIETSISVPTIQRPPLTHPEDVAQAGMLKAGTITSAPRSPSAMIAGGRSSMDAVPRSSGLLQTGFQTGFQTIAAASLTSPAETTVTISPATPARTLPLPSESSAAPVSPSASRLSTRVPPVTELRKHKSSASLKNNRTLSVSSPEGSEGSLGTPMSMTFSAFAGQGRKGYATSVLAAPTPTMATFSPINLGTEGAFLLEADIHSPYSPGTPNTMIVDAPLPLEPCPELYLLRPFWLMRCLYQTIAHPRGGYLSKKIFVPRDVWRVRGVKIKAVDEKISNCDLLTAALLKVGNVDTLDADALLEEMQSLEHVLDQVQATLTKKLGSEVGVHSIGSFFKDAPVTSPDGNQGADSATASKSASSKSYLSSWRRLRSKSSNVGLSSVYSAARELPKDALTMSTLPMTSLPNIRLARREVSRVDYSGPNANYMSALARLCDAVQVVDQIARQVEDPGLKHSSPTHVGLELSVRHASEFFGFYICRFVLTDLTMLLDKFIKRGSEWVLV